MAPGTEPPTDVALADRAAYLPAADALVCADLHLGRDAESNVELPLGERERVPDRIAALVERFAPETVVLAGDVLHAFDSVPESAAAALTAVHEVVADAGADLAPVAGNHDAMLASVLETEVPAEHRIDDVPNEDDPDDVPNERRLDDGTLVSHGDALPSADADRYVVGHEHPAIVVEGDRRPCYLHGPAPDGDGVVLVLPAFNELTRGSVVNGARGDDLQTPFVTDVDRFRPAVRDPDAGETLWFPPLGEFRRLL